MNTFTQSVQEWQVFYTTVGAACATLTGLLFVALSLNVDILSQEENRELMWVAQRTFGDFLLVLMVSLIFLIPHHSPLSLVVALFAFGAAWTFSVSRSFWKSVRERKNRPGASHLLQMFGLSLVGCLSVLLVATAIMVGFMDALYWLVFGVAALLASSSRNAWFLLVQVREKAKKNI
jgi:hypothetical protein